MNELPGQHCDASDQLDPKTAREFHNERLVVANAERAYRRSIFSRSAAYQPC